MSFRSTRYLGGGPMKNDYKLNQNYQALNSRFTCLLAFIYEFTHIDFYWELLMYRSVVFDHNYKMLVNILFIRRPSLIKLNRLFSTQVDNILLSIDRFERYYKPKMTKFDPLAKQILTNMASSKCNKSVLKNMIQNYRQIQYKRHPQGLVTLLCAINQCKDIQIRDLGRHIVEFIVRSKDASQFICDSTQLSAILAQFAIKKNQSFQKIKQTVIKYKLAELLVVNHTSIVPLHFHDIVSLLTNNDRLIVTSTVRFATLANILKEKIFDFVKDYLKNGKKSMYGWLATPQFVANIFYFFRDFPTQNDAESQLLYEFVEQSTFSLKNKNIKKLNLYSIHRNFPYQSRNSQGEYYKDLILKRIVECSSKIYDQGEDWNQSLLCYSILSFQFYKTMNAIQFRYEEDLNYLKKEDLKIPQLPAFYWQKYEENPKIINKDHIARNIIKKVYPEKYKSTPDLQSSTIKPPKITQNEIKIRTISALELLGLKWKRQVQVGGRYVDFLIDDIVIQCDGDYHFDLYKMDYDQSTHFRNLHILLSGYKLLIFNIFEYNRHRTTQQLAELIKRKLDHLQKNDAVMIL